MTKRSQLVLFDVLDTVVKDPYFTVVPDFFSLTLEDLYRLKDPENWFRFERGEISEDEYAKHFFSDGRTFDYDALKQKMIDAYAFLDGMETLLARVCAAQSHVVALSNYPVWYRALDDKLVLSRFLDSRFVSYKTGFRKPDTKAFTNVVERFEYAADDVVFVDDREKNCRAASSLGIKSIHFRDAASCEQELKRLRVVD